MPEPLDSSAVVPGTAVEAVCTDEIRMLDCAEGRHSELGAEAADPGREMSSEPKKLKTTK
jgi:hypothetical protein